MRQLFTVALFICLFSPVSYAQQDSVWSLQRCVQYALDHNISIQQNVLNKRLAEYTLKQSQLAQLPSVNASSSLGRSFGRSINPTTNQFVEGDYDFLSLSGNANVLLFGWFQQRNLIKRNKFNLQAAQADLDQLKDDVSLNVATGYLRALLAKEQIYASEKQVDLSKAQVDQTRSFVEAGRLPELNLAQEESQLATDSSNLITAISTYNSSILDLKTLLNLDFATPFDVLAPDVKIEDQIELSTMQPEQIYSQARSHFGSVKGSELRVNAAQKGIAAARGALYPQLSLSGQIGTNWASNYSEVTGYTITGAAPNGSYIPLADTLVQVYQPTFDYTTRTIPLNNQLSNNFRQTIAINLNIPLFNSWQSQYNLRQSQINLATAELNEYNAELTLKQNVYKAYNDAVNSIQKFYAAQRAADAAHRALNFAKKRYDLGLTSTVDFLVTQNSDYTATYNLLSAKYDLIFKLKVIDYYLGKELKL